MTADFKVGSRWTENLYTYIYSFVYKGCLVGPEPLY